ncbi:hypothetical protein [Undibacterium sp. TC4M20W]|uniref:hypothetical protein n=1 Tax=Undibacterium sp. TC4M20W TaxID=3413052 RepID=UPI003BF4FC65
MDTLGLSLAWQIRDGSYVDTLEIKSFLHYKVPLFLLAANVYLVGANFDDDSFGGEGKILRQYLKPCKKNAFLVDKALCNEVASLSQYILGKHNRQLVKGKLPSTGDLFFEFAQNTEITSFDLLFKSSFALSHMSVQEFKRGLPGWHSIMEPGIVERHVTYIVFSGHGTQLNFVGPANAIRTLRKHAEGLVRDWPEAEFFLDTVDFPN